MTPTEWFERTDLARVRRKILEWYVVHQRDLPWRRTRDPYSIWISEVMLQQTTVATVLGYFNRFLAQFPDVAALARADISDVLHCWQGLGYYRRAHHLHQCALRIMSDGGSFPRDPDALASLPGFGRYTANAVGCFAFDQRLPIIEANTRRLWTRVCGSVEDPTKPPLREDLWGLAEKILPRKDYAAFNQAVMDIGSEICTPQKPACERCPLRHCCVARQMGLQERIPFRQERRSLIDVDHVSVVVWKRQRHGADKVLVHRRPADGLWGGLWEFPRVESLPRETSINAAARALASLELSAEVAEPIITVRHPVMHYRIRLTVHEASLKGSKHRLRLPAEYRWCALSELPKLAFSSPQRKIVKHLITSIGSQKNERVNPSH